MNRRKFIKTGLQLGGAGFIASTLGCQGSLFDSFDSSAEEAFLVSGSRLLYKVNLITGAASSITPVFPDFTFGLALRGKDTALVLTNLLGGDLYSINLNSTNSSFTSLISSFAPTNTASIVLENQQSVLVGDNGNLTRLNLSTLTSSTIVSGLGDVVTGLAMESSQSVLVQMGGTTGMGLLRVNLSSGTSNFLQNMGASTFTKIAIVPDRNLVLIANSTTTTQIKRLDLSTNTLLSDIGFVPSGAGLGIALENSHSALVGSNAAAGGLYRVDLDTGVTSRVDDGSLGSVSIVDIAVRFQ